MGPGSLRIPWSRNAWTPGPFSLGDHHIRIKSPFPLWCCICLCQQPRFHPITCSILLFSNTGHISALLCFNLLSGGDLKHIARILSCLAAQMGKVLGSNTKVTTSHATLASVLQFQGLLGTNLPYGEHFLPGLQPKMFTFLKQSSKLTAFVLGLWRSSRARCQALQGHPCF